MYSKNKTKTRTPECTSLRFLGEKRGFIGVEKYQIYYALSGTLSSKVTVTVRLSSAR